MMKMSLLCFRSTSNLNDYRQKIAEGVYNASLFTSLLTQQYNSLLVNELEFLFPLVCMFDVTCESRSQWSNIGYMLH